MALFFDAREWVFESLPLVLEKLCETVGQRPQNASLAKENYEKVVGVAKVNFSQFGY